MAKLMLVEDDNNLREIYEARLQAEGYTIVTARDGEEALVVAKAEKPDLIIADVMMPKISGFEMLDILRNTDGLKDVKIIMLTALGQNDDQQRANRLGADRYMVKSQVTLEDIVKVTHELLEDDASPGANPPAGTDTAGGTPAVTQATEPTIAAPKVEGPADPTPAANDTPATAPVPPAQPDPPTNDDNTAPAQATVEPSPVVSASAPQSAAQEAANVEARIEDFVAGATEEATLPPGSPPAEPTVVADTQTTSEPPPAETPSAVAPEPVAEPVVEPAPEQVTPPAAAPVINDTASTDDALMDNAVQTLVSSTEDSDTAAEPAKAEESQVISPTTQPEPDAEAPAAEPTAPPAEKKSPQAGEEKTSSVPIAHKKVITPIESDPNKDINTLLALEEAKQAASQGPPPPTAVIATNEAGVSQVPLASPAADQPQPTTAQATIVPDKKSAPPALPAPGDQVDPGSIAL